jgi:membrane protein DedA with SNARE-associated domain
MRPIVAATRAGVHGLGVPAALALLVPMEAGVPIPIPSDLVMLGVGERAAAGAFPLWVAVIALEAVAVVGTAALFLLVRGPGHAVISRAGPRIGLTEDRLTRAKDLLKQRGRPALAVGRGTPGLRTVTVVAAGGSGLTLGQALPALAVGSSVFLQLHLFLGYFLGPYARRALHSARGPVLVLFAAALAGAVAFWLLRRGRRAGPEAWAEAACPACLALGLLSERRNLALAVTKTAVTKTTARQHH